MKKLIKNIIKTIISPRFWINLPKNSVLFAKKAVIVSFLFATFFVLLVITLMTEIYLQFTKIPLLGVLFKKFAALWNVTMGKYIVKFANILDSIRTYEVPRSYLIFLAFENLRIRKSRTIVTIAGMSFGVGIIVLLLSLGYGIERLVINKVASLDELNVVDVSTGGNTAINLSRDIIGKIKSFAKIDSTVPLVSMVGRVSINKATTDVLVYSTTNEYFNLINAKLKKGKFFEGNELSLGEVKGEVAGASTSLVDARFGDRTSLNTLEYNILPDEAAIVYEECRSGSKILGYTARVEGGFTGYEYWGNDYYPFENEGRAGYDSEQDIYLGLWVKGVMPIFDLNADNTLRPSFNETGVQIWTDACVQKRHVQVNKEYAIRAVLGESTEESTESAAIFGLDSEASGSALFAFDAEVIGTDSAGVELVDLTAQENAKKKEIETIKYKGGSRGQAIISSGLLALLGIPEANALDTTFKASIIVGKNHNPEISGKAFSEEVEYKILGVVDDDQEQYFYVPLSDSEGLGVTNFSQAKIVLLDRGEMDAIRKRIEDLGFRTASTADTVEQIESLFGNLRLVLGLLGMVALGVASLGMFNTLTVSLLERTREIGGMKTIGMVTQEVQDLFLSEAMIMGLSGGVGGLVLGFIIGKILSLGISIFSISRGGEFLNLTYIPPFLIFFIIVSSFVVGVFTGLYPAVRAKKISALNALRYE